MPPARDGRLPFEPLASRLPTVHTSRTQYTTRDTHYLLLTHRTYAPLITTLMHLQLLSIRLMTMDNHLMTHASRNDLVQYYEIRNPKTPVFEKCRTWPKSRICVENILENTRSRASQTL